MALGRFVSALPDGHLIKRHLPSLIVGGLLMVYGGGLLSTAFDGKSMGSLIQLQGELERLSISDSSSKIEFRFKEFPGRVFVAGGMGAQDKEAARTLESAGDPFDFAVAERAFRDRSQFSIPVYQLSSVSYRYVSRRFSSFAHDDAKLLGGAFGLILGLSAIWLLGTALGHIRQRSTDSDPLVVFTACHPRKAGALFFAMPAIQSMLPLVATACLGLYAVFLVWFHFLGSKMAWLHREREIHAAKATKLTQKVATEVPQEIKMIDELIKRNAVDTPNAEGLTPLHLACAAGRVDAIELLLRSGAKINRQDNAGKTPLIHAVSRGHLAVVMKLVERFADLKIADATGGTAMAYAQKVNKESVIQVLRNASSRKSALHAAAAAGDVGRLYKLVKSGLDIDSQDAEGQTALMVAVKRNALGAVLQLLKLNANTELADKGGMTPLQLAEKSKKAEIANALRNPPPKEGSEESEPKAV